MSNLEHRAMPPGRASARTLHYGAVIAADMTTRGDLHYRVALEARSYSAPGATVGLLHAGDPSGDGRISGEVQACVRRNLATPIGPDQPITADLLVIHAPASLGWTPNRLASVRAKTTVVVCHRAEDFAVPQLRQRLAPTTIITYAPVNAWIRAAAPKRLKLAAEDWRPPQLRTSAPPSARACHSRRIAWLCSAGSELPPEDTTAGLDIVRFSLDATQIEPDAFTPSLDRLAAFGALIYLPREGEPELPDALVQTALANGATVVLPSWLKPHYGKRPLYVKQPGERSSAIRRAAQRPAVSAKHRSPRAAGATGRTTVTDRRRPVMFVTSNGVGVGHVNRLLAIARRLNKHIPAMFVTQAQAVRTIESFGYLTEYVPSAGYVGGSFDVWDKWFGFQLEQLIDSYDPAAVVYDGNNPSDGLVRAVAARPDCRLAWVRRGLWGTLTSPFIDNARWCDLIVEPGELDGQPDEGVTAQRRPEALVVPPIRLLDEPELLSRDAAAKAVGLDAKRPAALIQLGAGYNRDIVSLIGDLVGELQKVRGLQICIAEWVNGAEGLSLWSGIKLLRGFPLSQYYRAFDFSIAAAGYNTFHDAIALGLPTIFIPNRHPAMDDQAARAEYAQSRQAAFELDEEDLSDLPDLIMLMMDEKARAFIVEKGSSLRLENGAAAAANAIESLAGAVS